MRELGTSTTANEGEEGEKNERLRAAWEAVLSEGIDGMFHT